MQVTVNVKEDKKQNLVSAFEKRISLLEKLLVEVRKSKKDDINQIVKTIENNRDKDSKKMSSLLNSLASAIKKVSSPKITVEQKDTSSELAKAINGRISMLEKLLKKKMNNKELIREIRNKQTKIITNNNTIVESIRGRDSRTVPSPS